MSDRVPAYFLHCNKHKQDMVEFKRRGMILHHCAVCVTEARDKIKLERASFRARGYDRVHNP